MDYGNLRAPPLVDGSNAGKTQSTLLDIAFGVSKSQLKLLSLDLSIICICANELETDNSY